MNVTGSTRVAGVIGWPARHSLSPVIHNAAFRHLGLDWVYVAFEVRPGEGGAAVEAVRSLGLGGLNVTMPHKGAAWKAVDARTEVAEALQAVNTVFWDGDRLVGDNTDGAGFLDSLRDEGVDPAGMDCVVVGAGGAGRAVAWALAHAGADRVTVVNRSPEPAERSAALAGAVGRVGQPGDVARADLVVNATPVGMGGGVTDPSQTAVAGPAATPDRAVAASGPLPFDPHALRSGQVVVDLIYDPETTPLLVQARARGGRSINGLGMLVHQAAHAFRRWTGEEPPVGTMAEAVSAELARRAGGASGGN